MNDIDFSRINLLVLDVDGVLTDGRIIYGPGGGEWKHFHVRDGSGLKYWRGAGGKVAWITGRGGPAVETRARELGIDLVRSKIKEKAVAYRAALAELDATEAETAVMGDDLTDLAMLKRCGFAAAPADAVDEVRQAADYVTTRRGGDGAVREVIELILRGSGRWDAVLRMYEGEA